MKRLIRRSAGILIATQLIGCASVVSGTHQNISIVTSPVQGAQCSLENNKGKWLIPKTPGDAVVHKSGERLIIICEKKGYNKAISKIKPGANKAAYGNILLGGMIGAAVDHSNGAAFLYPDSVKIALTPEK